MLPESAIRILLIEDDVDFVDILRMCLNEPDAMGIKFELEREDRLESGLRRLEGARFDAILLDLHLPDSRGLETVVRTLERAGDIPILVMTSAGGESAAFEAMRLGAQDYLVKSTSDSRLLKRAIWYAIERRKVLAQTELLIRRNADAMVVVDRSGSVQYMNAAAEELFGLGAKEMLGGPFPYPAAAGETSLLRLASPNGETRTAQMRVVDIQWRENPALLASIRDITELQRVEQLKAEIKERRKVDQLKDELIATVSHELRTPLTIVKGAVDNLKEEIAGPITERQREVVGLADRNISRLAKMINNLLGLSRLESGRAKARKRRLSAQPLLEEVLQGFQMTGREASPAIQADLGSQLGEVAVDAEMIAEVLGNLLDNARRYGKERVLVRARRVEAGSSPAGGGPLAARGGVLVEVIDDGPGIPEDRIGDIFNKFVQVNRSLASPGYKGTGLGLAICREIMSLHGSFIKADSSPAGGARFSFLLPEYREGDALHKTPPPSAAAA